MEKAKEALQKQVESLRKERDDFQHYATEYIGKKPSLWQRIAAFFQRVF